MYIKMYNWFLIHSISNTIGGNKASLSVHFNHLTVCVKGNLKKNLIVEVLNAFL